MHHKLILVLVVFLLFLSLTSCSADCIWYDDATAWLDENKNGVWDNEEKPLIGVRFLVNDVLNGYQNVGEEAISGDDGKAQLSVWMPGCPSVEFEIFAVPPEGFEATTPDRIVVSKKAFCNPGEELFSFGFVSANGE